MATSFLAYLKCFEESNPKKKEVVVKWILSHIDYSQSKKGLPVCFYRNTSFYLTALPDFRRWPPDFKARVFMALVDRDMREDLERTGLINWCHNVRTVIPINVPKDGNCLLHSVSVAVWGISDSKLMLRRLLGLVLRVDQERRFHSRWMHHRQIQISQFVDRLLDSGVEGMTTEWEEICQCLDPDRSYSVAVPHRFLESVHVYTLANILRRPIIIMTDPTIRTFSGMSLQDNDMGGIYLPLEWNWADTHCTPILLGYSNSHFCPLLFADHPKQAMAGMTQEKDLAPLVNQKFEQLPVRFLLEGEEPEVGELLRKYLKIKETVMQVNETIQNILCAELETCNLPDELNLVQDYIQDCRRRYEQEMAFVSAQHLQNQAALASQFGAVRQEPLQQSAYPFTFSQAPASPQHVVREQLLRMGVEEYGLGDPALHNAGMFRQSSVHIPPPSFTPMLSFTQQNVSLNPSKDEKCVVPTCKFFGDPDLAMMCSSCFRNYSIKESRSMAAARSHRPLPTAPLPSLPAEEEHLQMSMMNERCKEGCGLRCSTQTYPYCHECADKLQKRAQKKAVSTASGSSTTVFATPGSLNAASSTMGSAALPSSPVPQEGLGAVSSTQLNDQNAGQGTSSSARSLPTASAGSGMPQEHQAQSGAASPHPAAEMFAEAMSPTQVLTTANLSAPLTPPDDTNDQQLFGSGHPSTVSPSQVGGMTSPTEPQPQTPLASLGQSAASAEPSTAQPQTADPGQSSQQQLLSLPGTQQQQQPEMSHVREQNLSSSGDRLRESHQASIIMGGAVGELKQGCSNPACSEDAVFKHLCGKCYVGQGTGEARPRNPTVEKAKITRTNSTSSSAPASFGLEPNPPKPEEMKKASSQTYLPSEVPFSNSKVRNWLDDNKRITASKGRREAMMPSGPRSHPLGLPEKQEGEPLGSSDLVASGEGCFSSTYRCIGMGCGNMVQQEGKLCQQCQDILCQARQGRGVRLSVQESLAQEQPCQTEGCQYYGDLRNLGFCSRCYGQQFKRQLEVETRQTHPANPAQAQNQRRTISVPPQFHFVPTAVGRQGLPCTAPGCNMFGDPKQADMCWTHYQEHLATVSSTTSHSAPVAGQRNNSTIKIPYASQVLITPTSTTIYTPALNRTVEAATSGFFPESQVTVPPPSVPSLESGLVEGSRIQEPSLGETYKRVAGHHAKCLNPSCTNFGNSSKGGLCNSCAKNQTFNDEWIGRIIYGEEETG